VLDGVGGEGHALAALPSKMTGYVLYVRLGVLQGRSEQVRRISSLPGVDPGPSIP